MSIRVKNVLIFGGWGLLLAASFILGIALAEAYPKLYWASETHHLVFILAGWAILRASYSGDADGRIFWMSSIANGAYLSAYLLGGFIATFLVVTAVVGLTL